MSIPEREHEIVEGRIQTPRRDFMKDHSRLLLATFMATVTFAASLAVSGGYNSSGAGQDHGIASALKKTMFHLFSACSPHYMFNSMVMVVMLLYPQINDP